MALTLGDLRTFCQDVASPDSMGLKASRQFMVAINAALSRIYLGFQFDQIDHVQKITVPPYAEGSLLTVTQNSLALALTGAETFLDAYADDEWALIIDGEDRFVFELASVDTTQTATMKAGDEWIKATAAGTSYKFAKVKFTLPNSATHILRLEHLNNGFSIAMLSPQEFDREKAVIPAQIDTYPRIACFRAGKVEIWPNPSTDYQKIEISYRKGPPNYSTSDADATELDWPEVHEDLVHKALQLEFALIDGENSVLPLGAAAASWEECFKRHKAIDAQKADLTGPMRPYVPSKRRPHLPRSWSGGTATDV